MLLENNNMGNINGLALGIALIVIGGLVSIYLVIVYLMHKPKMNRLMMTYSDNLKAFSQRHVIKRQPHHEEGIVLTTKE